MILSDYTSPDWVDIAGDTGIVLGALVALSALVAVVAKVVRIIDKRRENHFATQVGAVVAPLIASATQAIQPNYRNGGHSLADVAEEVRGAKDAIATLRLTGEARDAQVGEIRATLETIDLKVGQVVDKTERIEQRQAEMVATAERSLEERDAMVQGMLANGAVVWDALTDLGADLPPMKMPPKKEKKP